MTVRFGKLLGLLTSLLLLAACMARTQAETFATGLSEPRGMTFDAAGDLFVAEAGGAATTPTNHSGRVLRITPDREVRVVVDQLPFSNLGEHGDVGSADIAMLNGALYLLTGEGSDVLSREVLRVVPGGPPQPVASIRNFAAAGLSRDLLETGLVAANPYAMVAAPDGSALYVADGASGRVLRVQLDGTISVFAELPGMPPLAGLAFGPDGRLYFTMFSFAPHTPGSGAVWAADPAGKLTLAADGLTMPIDVGFDAAGRLYVLEFGDGKRPAQPYAASVGRLLRIAQDGTRTVLLDQLNYPTALAFSRTGDLYIAVGGAFTAPRQGAIVKVACAGLGTCG